MAGEGDAPYWVSSTFGPKCLRNLYEIDVFGFGVGVGSYRDTINCISGDEVLPLNTVKCFLVPYALRAGARGRIYMYIRIYVYTYIRIYIYT